MYSTHNTILFENNELIQSCYHRCKFLLLYNQSLSPRSIRRPWVYASTFQLRSIMGKPPRLLPSIIQNPIGDQVIVVCFAVWRLICGLGKWILLLVSWSVVKHQLVECGCCVPGVSCLFLFGFLANAKVTILANLRSMGLNYAATIQSAFIS